MTKFTTADEVTSIVKEELNSYFASHAVDDVMFPKWVDHCMSNFKKSALPVDAVALSINNFSADLPDDFDSVKEIWACGLVGSDVLQNQASTYYQTDCRITPSEQRCDGCEDMACEKCSGKYPDKDERYRVTHKVTGSTVIEYYFKSLLRPGNNNAVKCCGPSSPNIGASSLDEFDIRDCKVITNFQDGFLHLVYYKKPVDENGNTLIIDNSFVKEYIINYLKYKVFESLTNSTNDESANQLFQKMMYYKQEYISSKITAETELKKWDKYKLRDQIIKRRNEYSFYRRSVR